MKKALLTLLTSKRVWIALLTAIANVLVLFGLELDPALAGTLATVFTSLAVTLIGAITGTDMAAAKNAAQGLDHKGRDI